jgi:hypothetical protein
MANQQLIDYVKSQLALGVGKEAVRGELAQAGWAKEDIDDSMKAEEVVSAATPASSTRQPVSPAWQGSQSEGVAQKSAQISPNTISVSDLIPGSQLEMAPTANMKMFSGKKEKEEKKVQSTNVSHASSHLPKFHASIAVIVLTVVSLAFAGGAAYFYMQGKDLQEKSVVLGTANDTMSTKIASLNAQVSDLTKAGDDLKAQLGTLTSEKDELAKYLVFFVAPAGSSGDLPVTAKGALSGGGKVLYALTLENGIRLSIVNSKDAKVDGAFKALASTSSVEISGTHTPGFRDVTVTAVNGTSVQ